MRKKRQTEEQSSGNGNNSKKMGSGNSRDSLTPSKGRNKSVLLID